MDSIQDKIGTYFVKIAVPILAVYAIGLGVLPQYGYVWHPYVSIAQGFIAPLAGAIARGYFWGPKAQP